MFGSWVEVISDRLHRLPKTPSWNTTSATLKGHRKSRIQPNSNFFFAQMLWIKSGIVLAKTKKKLGLGALQGSNFIQKLLFLSASLGFHGPPLFTVKTDRLDFRGLDRG